jgi:lipopolysaccharide transport system permease protein
VAAERPSCLNIQFAPNFAEPRVRQTGLASLKSTRIESLAPPACPGGVPLGLVFRFAPGLASRMTAYLSSIWKCRYFWMSLVQMDLRNRYRRSVLGMGWSMLHPLIMTAVLCTVFHRIFNQDVRTFGPFLLVGLCFWNFVATVVNMGCNCLFQGEAYIRQYPAPMAIYPLRTVLGAATHFLTALVVVVGLSWLMNGFGNVPALTSLLPTILLLCILGWSLAVIFGFSTAYFPDMKHLAEVGLQILFYATPIIYPPQVLRDKGLGLIADVNPLASVVTLLREPILHGRFPSLVDYGIATCMVALIFLISVTMLVKLQKKIIFQL